MTNKVVVNPKPKAPALKYNRGTLWQHNNGPIYIMAQTGTTEDLSLVLVSLNHGCRWVDSGSDPFGGDRGEFVQIPPGSDVTITVGGSSNR